MDRKEAIRVVKDNWPEGRHQLKEALEILIPELKESEDEKIRKELIQFFSDKDEEDYEGLHPMAQIVAWLENQGQVKESIISQHENKICKESDDSLTSENERIRKAMIDFFKHEREKGVTVLHYGVNIERMITWLEKQGEHANFRNKIQIGDKVTRNEDGVLVNLSQLNRVAKKDENMIEAIEALCDDKIRFTEFQDVKEYTYTIKNWLKSLKERVQPQPKQEWSEEDERIYQSIMDDTVQENQLNDKQTGLEILNIVIFHNSSKSGVKRINVCLIMLLIH